MERQLKVFDAKTCWVGSQTILQPVATTARHRYNGHLNVRWLKSKMIPIRDYCRSLIPFTNIYNTSISRDKENFVGSRGHTYTCLTLELWPLYLIYKY